MTVFDQRGQKVTYQFNSAGDINFNTAKDKTQLIAELNKFKDEIKKAIEAKAIEEDIALDVEYKIAKATQQVQKAEPDKKNILDYLQEAKAIIENVTAASGMVIALTQAIQVVQRLF